MAQVNVTISGKLYRMACDDGQEEHLGSLVARLDETIEHLRGTFGEIGDQRLTVMAAITLADQNSEAERRLTELEARIAALDEARGPRSKAGRRPNRRLHKRLMRPPGGSKPSRSGLPGDSPPRVKPDCLGLCAIYLRGWRQSSAGPICKLGEAAGGGRRHVSPGPYRS